MRLPDVGTQGLYLLPFLQQTAALIVFDAIDCGLPLATMQVVGGREVPAFLPAKRMSLHHTGPQDGIVRSEMPGHGPADASPPTWLHPLIARLSALHGYQRLDSLARSG